MSNKNENEVKVGDRVILNQSFPYGGFFEGEIGIVRRLRFGRCTVKFKGRKATGMCREDLDLAPDQPATAKPPEKKPIKKGDYGGVGVMKVESQTGDANRKEFQLSVMQNIERNMSAAKRKRTMNWAIVKEYLLQQTSRGGSTSSYVHCRWMGVEPDSYSFFKD